MDLVRQILDSFVCDTCPNLHQYIHIYVLEDMT